MYGVNLLSFIATLTTIIIIFDMKVYNGYIYIILSLTVCELIYDASVFTVICYILPTPDYYCVRVSTFFLDFSGVAACTWSNVISIVVTSTILNLKSFNIDKYYKYFFLFVTCLSFSIAMWCDSVSESPEALQQCNFAYFSWRIFSIALNTAAYIIINYKLRRMNVAPNSSLSILARRFSYYPICGAITRLGASWYEAAYSFGYSSIDDDMPTAKKVALIFYAFLTPSAGIWYFIIFLMMQPYAYNHLMQRIYCKKVKAYSETDIVGSTDTTAVIHNRIHANIEFASPSTSESSESEIGMNGHESFYTSRNSSLAESLSSETEERYGAVNTNPFMFSTERLTHDIDKLYQQTKTHNSAEMY